MIAIAPELPFVARLKFTELHAHRPTIVSPEPASPNLPLAWSLVRDGRAAESVRLEALRELAVQPTHELARFVADALADPTAGLWRRALVAVAEICPTVASSDRPRLADALFGVATTLAGDDLEEDGPTIWAALRRASVLIPEDAPLRLLPFLEPSMRVKTRQAALQSLFNVEEVPVEREVDFPEDVARRVYEMADRLLWPDVVGSSEMAALAISAFKALMAIEHPGAPSLAARVASLPRKGLGRSALRSLARLEATVGGESRSRYLAEIRRALQPQEGD